jgi:zinc protease
MRRIHISAALLVCFLMASVAIPAWASTIDNLKFPPLNQFQIPQPDRYVLDNGITVYLLEDHTLPKLTYSAIIHKCGDYLEPLDKIGLAEMTGDVMRTGGTTSNTGDEIDEQLEGIGAYVETSIGTVSGTARAGGLSEYGEQILRTMADVLRNPVFDQDKIDLEKTDQKSTISRRNDDPMQVCIREFKKLIYGDDSPYARNTEYATIDAVTKDDMVAFHRKYVEPQNIQIAAWGDFNKTDMLALIKKYFGDWAKGTTEIPEPPKVDYTYKSSLNYAEKTDVTQSNILMGHIGGVMGDPDYPATIVMNSVLGGSFGSRLTNVVRTKLGLAYAAEGHFSFNYDYPGIFYAFASTKSESTVQAIRAMIEQIKSMQTQPPTDEEMKKAKDGWLNSFVFNFDTKGEILSRMMSYDYYGLPEDYLQQLKTKVEKVTPEDVLEVAKRKLHPDALQTIVVGKADEFGEPLSDLGEVHDIDLTIPTPKSEEFTATPDEIKEGHELLAKAAAACGGAANFKKVKSLEYSAKITVNTPQGAMKMDLTSIEVPPDKSAQIIKTPMGDQKVVFIGDAGWVSVSGQTQAMPASQLEDQQKSAKRDMVTLFANSDQPDYITVAARGTEDFGGTQAERLDFKTEGGDQFTAYLDPTTFRPIGLKYMATTMAGPGEVVEKLSDYRQYGDIMLPATRTQDTGTLKFDIDLVNVTVNGQYDATIFNKPEGI